MVLFRHQLILSTKSSYPPSCTTRINQTFVIWRSPLWLCLFAVYELKPSSVCMSRTHMVYTNAQVSILECTDRRITFTKFSLTPSYSNSTKYLPIYSPTAYLSLKPLKSFPPRFLRLHYEYMEIADERVWDIYFTAWSCHYSLNNHFCTLRRYR